jgi:hypothetical protein
MEWAERTRREVYDRGGDAWFFTLTMARRYKTAEAAYADLPRLFDNFRKIVQRKIKKWHYVAFVEGQPQRGYMPHLHVISIERMPERSKDLAVKAGFGYQTRRNLCPGETGDDPEHVTSNGAAAYVSKHSSKQTPCTPPNFRRVRTSQHFAKLPPRPKLLVKAADENVTDFLLRVESITGRSVDDLWADYEQTFDKPSKNQ